MKKWAEWATQGCAANQPISAFPVQSLLRHPVHISSRSAQCQFPSILFELWTLAFTLWFKKVLGHLLIAPDTDFKDKQKFDE